MSHYSEQRWYHVYLYFLTVATFISTVFWWLSGSAAAVVVTFGIATFIYFAAFLAEFCVMGFTATAGGFFWMVITSYMVCKYFPLS